MYNLSVLSDKEFELLCKDILEDELKIRLQVFRKGRDKGIDLRYACDTENKIIVQAKHFIGSKYADLKHKLLHEEKGKIDALQPTPQRYILLTSLSLTPPQVDEIVGILKPYVKDSNDIYTLDDIREIIKSTPKIEEKHYKLWLTSTNVLKRIAHNGIKGRSEFYEEKILQKLSLYVPTANYDDAIGKLNENRFIIITGEPGVGKTTISYRLLCDLLAKEYQLIYISDKIAEAENVLEPDPEVKQVIFFDDFLGSNIAEIINPRNSESAIVSLIERVIHLKNKFLVLTSRTTILNQANSSYEKLNNSQLTSISKYQVEVGAYSRLAKAKILYNHLYHSKLRAKAPGYYQVFFENRNYYKVIDHRNYSPRLIEFLTNDRNLDPSKAEDHLDFILNHLENPSQIWKGAYEHQLADEDRFLLTTLFSLGGYKISHNDLELAFQSRIRYEINENGFRLEHNAFNRSVRKLLDGFITAEKDLITNLNKYSFLNPSVGDFILNYLKETPQEKWRILRSITFVEQITKFFYPAGNDKEGHIPFSKNELIKFFPVFNSVATSLQTVDTVHRKSKSIEILKVYVFFFPGNSIKDMIAPWVEEIEGSEITSGQFSDALTILSQLPKLGFAVTLTDKWEKVFSKLFQLCSTSDDFSDIKKVFQECNIDLVAFLSREENFAVLSESLAETFITGFKDDPNLSDYTEQNVLRHYYEGYREWATSSISEEAYEQYLGFVQDCGFSDFDKLIEQDLDIDADKILDKMVDNHDYDNDHYEGGRISSGSGFSSDTSEIDNLFET